MKIFLKSLAALLFLALSIWAVFWLAVRKAARLAVYDEIMMSVKNHHIPATMRVDGALATIRDH